MPRFCSSAMGFLFAVSFAGPATAQFTAGNLVVLQVGDGSAALSNASTPTFLNQYSTTGTLINATALPTSGTNQLTLSGTATSEGQITRSFGGTAILVAGYDSAPGVASIASSTVARKAISIDATGAITAAGSTTLYSGNNIRGAFSDGTTTWGSGPTSGIVNLTSNSVVSNTPINNARVVNSFNGNLYFSTAQGNSTSTTHGIYQVVTGIPTTQTQLFDTGGSSSSYAFSISPGGSTVYIADDRAASGGGVQKWTLSGSTWSLAGTFTTGGASGARGLVVDYSGALPVLYATTSEPSGNRIVSTIDSGAFGTMTDVVAAPANTAFRGITFAPVPEPATVLGAGVGLFGLVRLARRGRATRPPASPAP
jgi:hypothetical protein